MKHEINFEDEHIVYNDPETDPTYNNCNKSANDNVVNDTQLKEPKSSFPILDLDNAGKSDTKPVQRNCNLILGKFCKIAQWFVATISLVAFLVNAPHFSCVFLLLASFLLAPIEHIRAWLKKKNIKTAILIAVATVFFIIGLALTPIEASTSHDNTNTNPESYQNVETVSVDAGDNSHESSPIGYIIVLVAIGFAAWCSVAFMMVKKYSKQIQTLTALNKTISFKSVKRKYRILHRCTSKRNLDNFDLSDQLLAMIGADDSPYYIIISNAIENVITYETYIESYYGIESTASKELCSKIKIPFKIFTIIEKIIFRNKKIKAKNISTTFVFAAYYISPAGRNRYYKTETYSFYELEDLFYEVKKARENRQTRQFQIKLERSKMTDSLRYDILKRDNFRCQICGSSANDGVKLHVDHILPVSKGGLSTPENLRTLCDRCNMGKSDKIE